jgi:hypothetical protein
MKIGVSAQGIWDERGLKWAANGHQIRKRPVQAGFGDAA